MANDLQLTLRIRGDASQLRTEIVGAQRVTQSLGPAAQGAGRQAASGLDQVGSASGRAREQIGRLVRDTRQVGTEAAGAGGQASRALSAVGGAAGAASQALSGLAGSLVAAAMPALRLAAVGVAIMAIARAGDEATQSIGRLQVATGSLDAAREVYDQLYRLSLQTGVATRDAAAAFQRFAIAARQAGATRADILAIVQLLQQAGAVAGASLQETTSATIQLGQALASGTLQGDELRAILEAMPNLAEALARELGVSLGELRRMGAEGRLTASQVIPALVRAASSMREEFDRLPPSMERAFAQLGVATGRFLGDLDTALGISRTIASVLSSLAGVLDRIRVSVGLGSAMESAEAAFASARQRLDQRRAAAEALEGQPAPGGTRGIVRAQLERAEADFREAEARLSALRQEGAARAAQEEAAAAAQRAETERQDAGRRLDELRGRLDGRLEIQRRYARDLNEIARGVELGLITPERAEVDRANIERNYRQQIAAIREGGAGATRAAVEERRRLIESLRTPDERYADEIERLRRILGSGADAQEMFTRGVVRAKEALRAASDQARQTGDNTDRLEGLFARLGEQLDGFGREAAKGLADALLGIKGLEGGMLGLIQRLASGILAKLIEEQITTPLVQAASAALRGFGGKGGGIGGLLGGLVSSFLGGAPTFVPGAGSPKGGAAFHSGGMAGGRPTFTRAIPADLFDATFREAPRFHTGTGPVLGAGEVPAILRKGEGVFTPEQMAAMAPAAPVTVQVIDQRGSGAPPVEMSEGRGPDGERVIRAIIRAETGRAIRDGALDRDMGLAFGLRRAGLR